MPFPADKSQGPYLRIFSSALIFFALCLLALPANALQEQVYSTETFSRTFIYPDMQAYVPAPPGGLSWDIFEATKEVPQYNKDGITFDLFSLDFSAGLAAHDGKTVTMQGYMFPLDDNENQSKFLFGPFPLSCPLHYHVPATLVIEAHADKPIPFTYDPVVLEGRLELVRGNLSDSPYYRLKNTVMTMPGESLVRDESVVRKKSWHPLYHADPAAIRQTMPKGKP